MITRTHIIIVGAALALIYWKKGKEQEAAKTAIQEAVPTDGTNWVGQSIWDRMSGSDLMAKTETNASGHPNATMGRIENAGVPVNAGWNGNIQ